jgi:hypothetical protein
VAAWIGEIPLRSCRGAAIGSMGQAAMGHGVNCLRFQPLGLKACLLGLLDRQILDGLCFLLGLDRFFAQLLLLIILSVCLLGISRSRLCRCCLLGAITGSSSGGTYQGSCPLGVLS